MRIILQTFDTFATIKPEPIIGEVALFCNSSYCGDLEMAPHVNNWSPVDGDHK